jgi:hypothetical protein
MEQHHVVDVPPIVWGAEHVLYVLIELAQVDVGEELTGQIADRQNLAVGSVKQTLVRGTCANDLAEECISASGRGSWSATWRIRSRRDVTFDQAHDSLENEGQAAPATGDQTVMSAPAGNAGTVRIDDDVPVGINFYFHAIAAHGDFEIIRGARRPQSCNLSNLWTFRCKPAAPRGTAGSKPHARRLVQCRWLRRFRHHARYASAWAVNPFRRPELRPAPRVRPS